MNLTFQEYQNQAIKTAVYPAIQLAGYTVSYVYPALGLAGEAGEVAEKIKKLVRDSGGYVTREDCESLKKELGDVLWYLSAIATEFSISLEVIAEENLRKLKSRQEREVLRGSGDER